MQNKNRTYFQKIYPRRWVAQRRSRVQNRMHRQYQHITLDTLQCADGHRVLECGCGSGELLALLHERNPQLDLVGMDLGYFSLQWARTEVLHADDRVHLTQAEITALPFPSNHFDRVLCSSVLWYVPQAAAAIEEMVRVLKPGGRFVFDVRNPYHITNFFTEVSLRMQRVTTGRGITYSYFSPRGVATVLDVLPVTCEITGYYVLLPTRLPLLGTRWGNWVQWTPWLAFKAGHGSLRWLAQKLLVVGHKLDSDGKRP